MPQQQFGGRITFTFAGNAIPPCMGDIIIDPASLVWEGMANYDGSAAFSGTPKLPSAEIKLRDDGRDWNALINQIGDCTIAQTSIGVTHYFTGCMLTGTPKINTKTGEIDGLVLMGGSYRKSP